MSSSAWKKLSLLQKPPSDWLSDGPEQLGERKAIRETIIFLRHSKDLFIKEAAGGKVGKGGGGKQREVQPDLLPLYENSLGINPLTVL